MKARPKKLIWLEAYHFSAIPVNVQFSSNNIKGGVKEFKRLTSNAYIKVSNNTALTMRTREELTFSPDHPALIFNDDAKRFGLHDKQNIRYDDRKYSQVVAKLNGRVMGHHNKFQLDTMAVNKNRFC